MKSLKQLKSELPKTSIPMLAITIVLVVVGLIMMFSASYANAIYLKGDGFHYIRSQAIYAVLGIVMMFVISYFPYRLLHNLAWLFYGVSYVMLAITLLMPPINNAKRWIIIGGFTFQPSELVKAAVIILFSHLISQRPSAMQTPKYGVYRFIVLLGAIALIMVFQSHISGLLIIFMIGLVLMIIGGTRIKDLLPVAGAGLGLVGLLLLTVPKLSYALERVKTLLSGGDARGSDYQVRQGILAIGSGGIFGLGLGNSRQKQLYVPEPQNDFVFPIICEEIGFIGALLIILLFIAFIFTGTRIAMTARDRFGALLTFGVTAQIGLQTLLNLCVVTGLIPNTGISLPFFSQGGTSLFILLCEVGIVLSVARYSNTNKN